MLLFVARRSREGVVKESRTGFPFVALLLYCDKVKNIASRKFAAVYWPKQGFYN